MPDRASLLRSFVADAGWADAALNPVAGDASHRRYDRLTDATGRTAILMDAPPDRGEDVRPFVRIAEYLNSIGLSAPTIFAADATNGFLLIEDLGDALFARVLEKQPRMSDDLYSAAIDVLVHLKRSAPPPGLPAYDAAKMSDLAALSLDWYADGLAGPVASATRARFVDILSGLLRPLDNVPRVLVQRDYHAENLLWLPDRDGVRRVGLLDFQDALLGHPAYDLVSVLQDARRDVPSDLASAMRARFAAANDLDPADLDRAYALLGAQRALRIIGVFARLCRRDGKSAYVDLIPRVWGQLQENLEHPALAPMRGLIEDTLPPPDLAARASLKSKCAVPA